MRRLDANKRKTSTMEQYGYMSLRMVCQVVILGTVLSSELGKAQSRCPLDSRNNNLATQFVIRGTSIQMPVGAFLLVRKNGEIGAIRLTNIDPAVTEDYGKFTYESYFPSDAAGLFRSGKLVRHADELDVRPSKGTRGIYYQPGLHKANIGKWTFAFDSPSRMNMFGISFWKGDYGYEFAPTSACDLSEIDADDKRLRWFRFDRNTSVILSLADLAK